MPLFNEPNFSPIADTGGSWFLKIEKIRGCGGRDVGGTRAGRTGAGGSTAGLADRGWASPTPYWLLRRDSESVARLSMMPGSLDIK